MSYFVFSNRLQTGRLCQRSTSARPTSWYPTLRSPTASESPPASPSRPTAATAPWTPSDTLNTSNAKSRSGFTRAETSWSCSPRRRARSRTSSSRASAIPWPTLSTSGHSCLSTSGEKLLRAPGLWKCWTWDSRDLLDPDRVCSGNGNLYFTERIKIRSGFRETSSSEAADSSRSRATATSFPATLFWNRRLRSTDSFPSQLGNDEPPQTKPFLGS